MAARLKETYINEVAPALMKKFEYKSVMQIPKLDKIVVNIACGEARENSKVLDSVVSDLMQITGQRPVMCRAKKSIANFKLREGMVIGAKVTLRGDRMYEFLDRFFNLALPRVRDFRGINPNSFDGRSVDLSYKEFELLTYFMENRGIALSREKILNNVWNYDYFGDARTIDTHVKKLRSKLGDKGELIKTIWGMGYKLDA